MKRRAYVLALAGVSTAGCLRLDSSGSTETAGGDGSTEAPADESDDEETPADDGTTGDMSEQLSNVRSLQQEAATTLQSNVEAFLSPNEETEGTIDTSEASQQLGEASSTLDEVGGDAPSSLQTAQEWLTTTVEATDSFNSGWEAFLTASSEVENQQFDAARESASEGQDAVSSAEQTFSEAQETGEELGSTSYPEESPEAYEAATTVVGKMTQTASAVTSLLSGYGELARGLGDFSEGVSDYQNGDYSAATEQFVQAKGIFESTNETFTTAKSEAPEEVKPVFDRFICFSNAYPDAMDHYERAANAAADGDSATAREEVQAGQADLDRCVSSESTG